MRTMILLNQQDLFMIRQGRPFAVQIGAQEVLFQFEGEGLSIQRSIADEPGKSRCGLCGKSFKQQGMTVHLNAHKRWDQQRNRQLSQQSG